MSDDYYEFWMGTWTSFWGCPLPKGATALGIVAVNNDKAALVKIGAGYFRAYHGNVLPLDKGKTLCAMLPFAMAVNGHKGEHAAAAMKVSRGCLSNWLGQHSVPGGLYAESLERYVDGAMALVAQAAEKADAKAKARKGE